MNKLFKIGFGFAALLALSFVVFAEEISESENVDTRQIVEVEVDGEKFRAPINDNIAVSEARKKFDMDTINNLFGKLREMVELVVVKRVGHIRLGFATMGIIPQAMSNARKLKELQKNDTTPPMAHGYANKMGDLVYAIASKKTPERIDAAEAKRRADNLIESIKLMTEQSSTGLYLDWTMFTVNDQPLTHYLAPILQWFRDHGYGLELKLFDGLAKVVKSLNSNNKN